VRHRRHHQVDIEPRSPQSPKADTQQISTVNGRFGKVRQHRHHRCLRHEHHESYAPPLLNVQAVVRSLTQLFPGCVGLCCAPHRGHPVARPRQRIQVDAHRAGQIRGEPLAVPHHGHGSRAADKLPVLYITGRRRPGDGLRHVPPTPRKLAKGNTRGARGLHGTHFRGPHTPHVGYTASHLRGSVPTSSPVSISTSDPSVPCGAAASAAAASCSGVCCACGACTCHPRRES
jgi:hypothetical protein